ncbi:MAG: hypothetical protein ABSB35_38710 [Bryobacteraceae bacterium]|jgi:hypothetical protein
MGKQGFRACRAQQEKHFRNSGREVSGAIQVDCATGIHCEVPLAASAADPNTLYSLRKLEAKKNKREMLLMTGHASPAGASAKNGLSEGVVFG